MIIKQFQYGPEKTNSYLIIEAGHSILVDVPSDKIIAEIEGLGVTLDYIILTHEHADHLWGLNRVRVYFACSVIGQAMCSRHIQDSKNNNAKYYHVYYAIKYKKQNSGLFDPTYRCDPVEIEFKDDYRLGWMGNELHLIHTPGHSEGSTIIKLNDSCIFSGDTILKGQETYVELTNGSEKDYKKYTEPIIKEINPEIRIYPGHGDPFQFKEWKIGGQGHE